VFDDNGEMVGVLMSHESFGWCELRDELILGEFGFGCVAGKGGCIVAHLLLYLTNILLST